MKKFALKHTHAHPSDDLVLTAHFFKSKNDRFSKYLRLTHVLSRDDKDEIHTMAGLV